MSNLNPYQRTEAETIAWSEGLKTASDNTVGVFVTQIDNGDYIKVRSVDFGKGARKFEASVATPISGGSIEIRLNNIDGELLGVCEINNTGGYQNWVVQSCNLKGVKGVHDLYFVFKGNGHNLFNFDWWKLKAIDSDY